MQVLVARGGGLTVWGPPLGAADVEITVVETRLVGGECTFYACIPTKTLRFIELSSALDHAPASSRSVPPRRASARLGHRQRG